MIPDSRTEKPAWSIQVLEPMGHAPISGVVPDIAITLPCSHLPVARQMSGSVCCPLGGDVLRPGGSL